MDENIPFSAQGTPQWFSPKHAGEKLKRICTELAKLAIDAETKKHKAFAQKLWEIQQEAEQYARYYLSQCRVQSVRIMEPSGAIYVILADGREVVVPQAASNE